MYNSGAALSALHSLCDVASAFRLDQAGAGVAPAVP